MDSCMVLEKDIQEMKEYFNSGATREVSWRKAQLKGLLKLLEERKEEMYAALKQDLGKNYYEAFRDEVGTLMKSVRFALSYLKEWMSGKKLKLPLIALLTSAELVPEPLGLVLIISTWNFPIGLSLEPLIGALAAGNTAVVKPSEYTPSCSSFLAKTIPIYLDNKAVMVVEGNARVGEHLLKQKWDKIFFTGSARVAKFVMSAAAENLTPVSLELGGKCPAVVDQLSNSFDIKVTAKRILFGKFGCCAGQACIAIDYVLVHENFASTLVESMKDIIKKMYGDIPKETYCISKIVNKEHLYRLKNLLDDSKVRASVVHGGEVDEENLFIEPTILLDPPLEAAIMTDEIFGPLLPIITIKKTEDSLKFINSRPKALALYVFTKNEELRKRMISETSSGCLMFNDAIIQYAADSVPFGGIGDSGMGRYHGKFSFDTFSHEKAVIRRSFLSEFWFRFPPWNAHKLRLLDESFKFDYIGLLLVILGLKRH